MIYSILKGDKKKPRELNTNPRECPYHIPDPQHYFAIDKANMINFSNLYHWRTRYIIHLVTCVVVIYFLFFLGLYIYDQLIGVGYNVYTYVIEPLAEPTAILFLFSIFGGWIPLIMFTNVTYYTMEEKYSKLVRLEYFKKNHRVARGKFVKCKKSLAIPLCASHQLDGRWSELNLKVYYLDDNEVAHVAYSFFGNAAIWETMYPGSSVTICQVKGLFNRYPLEIAVIPWFAERCPRVVENNARDDAIEERKNEVVRLRNELKALSEDDV